jgi:hypothetical protein
MPSEKRPLRVAILGVGTVGAEIARGFLRSPHRQIGPAGGRMLELVAIADMNVQGAVDRGMPREIIVPDAAVVIRLRRRSSWGRVQRDAAGRVCRKRALSNLLAAALSCLAGGQLPGVTLRPGGMSPRYRPQR